METVPKTLGGSFLRLDTWGGSAFSAVTVKTYTISYESTQKEKSFALFPSLVAQNCFVAALRHDVIATA